FNWGVAEEVGAIVEWLHASDAPGVAALVHHLQWRASNLSHLTHVSEFFKCDADPSTIYCPIALGCAIQDHGPEALSLLSHARIRQPLLLIPFLAKASDQELVISWDQCRVTADSQAMSFDDSAVLLSDEAQCTISKDTAPSLLLKDPTFNTRVPSSDHECMEALKVYAGKTYAPATEASRLAGAGAGLTDND
ncbi:MAG: hypothetical protein ACI810_002740, partial [Gammaproteobacteria bacterium]